MKLRRTVTIGFCPTNWSFGIWWERKRLHAFGIDVGPIEIVVAPRDHAPVGQAHMEIGQDAEGHMHWRAYDRKGDLTMHIGPEGSFFRDVIRRA